MKKLVIVIALLALTLSILAGCGNNQAAKKDDFSEPVELLWYIVGTQPPQDQAMVMDKINEYLKQKLNTTVKLVWIDYADYEGKMNTLCSAGDPFDICFTSSWTFDYRKGTSKGFFADTTELMDTYAPAWKKIMYPELVQASTINGKTFALANNKFFYYQQMYMFNKQMFDKYGFDINSVKSVESLEPIFAKVHNDSPSTKVFVDHTNGPNIWPCDLFDPIIGQDFPGAVLFTDKDCKVINQYELPEFQKFMAALHSYSQKGYMVGAINAKSLFRAGDVFCSTGVNGANYDIDATSSYKIPTISAPAQQHAVASTFSATGSMVAISANSKHPERAMALLNLVNTDPYLRNLLGYGIEGVHYTKIEGKENVIHLTERGKKNYSVPNYVIGNMALLYIPDDTLGGVDKEAFMAEVRKTALVSPLLGFTFNSEPVKNEIAAITNITSQMSPSLFSGDTDPVTGCPQLVEKCKAAGLDKVMAEMQKQIDEWKKTRH